MKRELKVRGLKCELTGVKLTARTAQLHHLDPGNYTVLDHEKFKLLSPTAHAFVEFIALLVHGNKTKVPRLDLLLAWIGPYLPEPERTVDKFYEELRRKE